VQRRQVVECLGKADAVIVIPPFAGLDRPSLAAHLLQACARREGFKVRVLYASLALAEVIGAIIYQALCYAPTSALLGERCFARAAYGAPAPGPANTLVEGAIAAVPGGAKTTRDATQQAGRGAG